jgi:ribosomal-protein-alanine N-acetyltransferase
VTSSVGPSLTTRVVTDRLVLRPSRATDVPELRQLLRANAAHLRPWEPLPPVGEDPASLTVLSNLVTRQRREWKRGASFAMLLTLREAGEPIIGRVNLGAVIRGAFLNAHLGYWIAEEHQGRGLMTEAVVGACAFAFDVAGIHRLQIAIMPRNPRSLRVAEKLRARREGLAERYLKIAGRWEDHVIFAITEEEWREREERREREQLEARR